MTKAKVRNVDGARFYTIEKKRYVSVTTTCRMLPKPFLQPWYANMEKKAVRALLEKYEGKRKYKKLIRALYKLSEPKSPTAANIYIGKTSQFGDKIHDAIHGYFKGHNPDGALKKKQRKCFKQFKHWWKASGFTSIKKESEFVVFSNKEGVAGTVDKGIKRKGKHEIVDWKTGSGVWPDHYYQLVIYILCCQEMGINVKLGWIVHVPRDGGKVKVYKVVPGKGKAPSFKQVRQLIAFWKMLNPKVAV